MPPYQRTFLTSVIARVDYQPILILDVERPSEFQNLVREEYPRFEEIRGLKIKQKSGSPISAEKMPIVWRLKDREQVNAVDLSSKYFALKTTRYTRFLEFFEKLTNLYNNFVDSYRPGIITRIVLRYINQINLTGNPFEWQDLLNENLYSIFNAFPEMKDSITRGLHNLQFSGDDYKIVFQFGISNSEFPNTITQKEFILDYDCMSEEEHGPNEVLEKFTLFNGLIQSLFEKSIGEGLRDIMNKGDES